jgi:glutamine amidotransferase
MRNEVVIVDYGVGNVQSIRFALNRLGYEGVLTSDVQTIETAKHVIFPGVGHAEVAAKQLKASGLDSVLKQLTQPVLGICLGMQLMCTSSEEGDTTGLGLFDLEIKRFDEGLKVPCVGWNKLEHLKSPLFTGLETQNHVYFVHSYYAPLSKQTIAVANYGLSYSAALQNDNFFGVQFHPERSGEVGEQILKNFLNL